MLKSNNSSSTAEIILLHSTNPIPPKKIKIKKVSIALSTGQVFFLTRFLINGKKMLESKKQYIELCLFVCFFSRNKVKIDLVLKAMRNQRCWKNLFHQRSEWKCFLFNSNLLAMVVFSSLVV